MFNKGDILNDTYEIIGPIGKGGLGTIYKAWHLRLLKEVVVKQTDTNVTGDINANTEANILKGLHHTYLPQVFDYVQVGTIVYTVLDFIPGRDLQSYLDEGYLFTTNELYKWFYQICKALEYLHSQGFIHSDIKPGNIMIKPDGDICLIDFNVSLSEDKDTLKGISETYASPEQFQYAQAVLNGQDPSEYAIDARTDIYSLGATFYHLMTYIEPTCYLDKMNPISAYELSYPESFIEIIEKTMERKPERRYKSMKQLIKVLERIQVQDKRVKHLKLISLVINAVLLVCLLVGIFVTYIGYCMTNIERFSSVYEEYLVFAESAETSEELLDLTEEMLKRSDARMSLNREPEEYYALYLNMADAYREQGELKKADSYYQKILYLEKGDIYLGYSMYQLELQEYAEASNYINKAIRAGVDSGSAYYVRGILAEEKGKIEEAVLQYKKAISLTSNDKYKLDAEKRLAALEGGTQ